MFQNAPRDAPKTTMEDFVVPEDHKYLMPVKMIKNVKDMQIWDRSEAYFEYIGFVLAINDAVKGKSISHIKAHVSETINNLEDVLKECDNLIDVIPPVQQPQRFGNQAFKSFSRQVQENVSDWLKTVLPNERINAIPEIGVYFAESFGNSTRIDYGTGHEMSFVMFLCCLFKIGVLVETDKAAVAGVIFNKYLKVCRKLQIRYRMEPAGSHGVWSLDDYQFIPFIWGSSQLVGNQKIYPSSFLDQEILTNYAEDYMFLSCITFINSVKSGPFAEHSNQLWSISGVPSWFKINGGLIKMYKVEVLSKFPVVQHVIFGSLLPLKPVENCSSIRKPRMGLTPPVSASASQASSDLGEDSRSRVTPMQSSESTQPVSNASPGND